MAENTHSAQLYDCLTCEMRSGKKEKEKKHLGTVSPETTRWRMFPLYSQGAVPAGIAQCYLSVSNRAATTISSFCIKTEIIYILITEKTITHTVLFFLSDWSVVLKLQSVKENVKYVSRI